jgi:hypothetical protein
MVNCGKVGNKIMEQRLHAVLTAVNIIACCKRGVRRASLRDDGCTLIWGHLCLELVFAFSGRAKQGPSCIAEDTTHFVVSVVHFSDANPSAA